MRLRSVSNVAFAMMGHPAGQPYLSPYNFLASSNVLYELGPAVFTMFVMWSCEHLDENRLPDTAP